jgi:translation elongation factor EF-G
MDKTGADFYKCLDDIVKRLGAKPVPIQLPIGAENNFLGIVDLVRMKGVVWDNENLGATFRDVEIPEDMVELAKEYRTKLVEAAVELDDAAMEAYLDGVERAILEQALTRHRFNRTAAGASLGLSLRQMRYRMARLGIGADIDAPDQP